MNSIKKNYIYNVIYQVLLIVIPIITSPYVSRVLGAEQIGVYTYCYTIVSYFVLFAQLGIVNHGSRSIATAKNQEDRNIIFSNIVSVQIILALLVLALYLIYLKVFNIEYHLMSIIMLLYLIAALFDVNWFFFGVEQFKITVTRNVLIKLVSTVLLFVFIKDANDVWKYGLLLGLSQAIGQVAIWPYLKKYVRFVKPQFHLMKRQIASMAVLFIPQIAVSLYKLMDKIMIGEFCTKSQLGYYEYASMVVNLPLGFITSLGTVMLPRIASLMSEGDNQKTIEYTHYSILFAVAMSTAFAFGLSAIAPTFIPFYFGKEFAPAAKLLVGLSVTLVFLAWANVVRTQYLIPSKKDREYIISLFSGAGANIVLNVLLIPKFNAWGAVIGTIVAEVIVCVIQTYMSRQYIPVTKYLRECVGFVFIGIVMFCCVRIIAMINMGSVATISLQVLVGGMIFLVLTFFYVEKVLMIPLLSLLKNNKIGG